MEMMLRLLTVVVLPAILLTAGVVNWSTTCCCGNSMVLEILHGTCGHHGEEHEGSDHSGNYPHSCHKSGGDLFLKAENLDTSHSAIAVSFMVYPIALRSSELPSIISAWLIPRGTPPDIPLLTQRWLI